MKKASKTQKPNGDSFFISLSRFLGPPLRGRRTAPGEIIWRKTCFFREEGNVTYPVPELTLLATKKGFLWLSKLFADWAKKEDPNEDDHDHVGWPFAPIDGRYSDEMEIRIGTITPGNKRKIFGKYGITATPPYRGDLRSQYKAQLRKVEADLRRLRRMEQALVVSKTK